MVDRVDDARAGDPIAQRLRDLGFVDGEPVRVMACGPLGADPLLIQMARPASPCAAARRRASTSRSRRHERRQPAHPPGRQPNCGKTALFNQLTGRRQKVVNFDRTAGTR